MLPMSLMQLISMDLVPPMVVAEFQKQMWVTHITLLLTSRRHPVIIPLILSDLFQTLLRLDNLTMGTVVADTLKLQSESSVLELIQVNLEKLFVMEESGLKMNTPELPLITLSLIVAKTTTDGVEMTSSTPTLRPLLFLILRKMEKKLMSLTNGATEKSPGTLSKGL